MDTEPHEHGRGQVPGLQGSGVGTVQIQRQPRCFDTLAAAQGRQEENRHDVQRVREVTDEQKACLHPIVVDEFVEPAARRCPSTYGWHKTCAMRDLSHNHSQRVLIELRNQCKAAWGLNFRRVSDAIRDEGGYRHEDYV